MRYSCIHSKKRRVLAIDPMVKGFAFAVLESPLKLIDWGCKEVKGRKNVNSLRRIQKLIEFYQPEIVVLEDYQSNDCRRCPRTKRLIENVIRWAAKKKVKVRKISRCQIKKVFAAFEASTKQQIAVAVADHFPELSLKLPRPRQSQGLRAGNVEDERMNIFDAISFALTYYLEKNP